MNDVNCYNVKSVGKIFVCMFLPYTDEPQNGETKIKSHMEEIAKRLMKEIQLDNGTINTLNPEPKYPEPFLTNIAQCCKDVVDEQPLFFTEEAIEELTMGEYTGEHENDLLRALEAALDDYFNNGL